MMNDYADYSGSFAVPTAASAAAQNIDLHHLIQDNAVLAPVVELRGLGGGMRCHLARLLKRAPFPRQTVIPVAAEGVVAHYGEAEWLTSVPGGAGTTLAISLENPFNLVWWHARRAD